MKRATAKYLAAAIVAMMAALVFYWVATELPLPEGAFKEEGYYFLDRYSDEVGIDLTSMPTKADLVFYGGIVPLVGLLFIRHAARREPKPDDIETRFDRIFWRCETIYQLGIGWFIILREWTDLLVPCAHYNEFAEQFCIHPDFLLIMERYPLVAGWMARYYYWHDSWEVWVRLTPIVITLVCFLAFWLIDRRYDYLAEIED